MSFRIRSIAVFFLISIVILIGNDVLSILYTNSMMHSNLKALVNHEAEQLANYIETANIGEDYVEEMLGSQLRNVAIAALKSLDPDIENVSNEQLRTLARELNVDDITLIRRTKDDIILEKSSDPNEIGLSAKPWGYWYKALEQLFEDKQVSIPQGQKLDHYWAGPLDYSTSNPGNIDKFGYYFDGSTNYIINPYFHDSLFQQYQRLTGADAIIRATLSSSSFLDIAVFNPDTFGKEPELLKQKNVEFVPFPKRDIYFGHYNYKLDSDVANVRRAAQSGKQQYVDAVFEGQRILKSFVPIQALNITLIVGIVADEHEIASAVRHQLYVHAMIVLCALFISVLCIGWTLRYIRKSKDDAVKVTQQVYIDEVNHMFTTIRGQRHDFINHVHTIHALATMSKWQDVKAYTAELVGEIVEANDLIRIGHPVIAAIIQSKVVSAIDKKITFVFDFSKCSGLQYGLTSLDIVKIIGNLIDNAFDEVMRLPQEQRRVEIEGKTEDGTLQLRVANPTKDNLSSEDAEKMFIPGFSTKLNSGHSGIGLPIIKNSLERYKGTIRAECAGKQVIFFLSIPLE